MDAGLGALLVIIYIILAVLPYFAIIRLFAIANMLKKILAQLETISKSIDRADANRRKEFNALVSSEG